MQFYCQKSSVCQGLALGLVRCLSATIGNVAVVLAILVFTIGTTTTANADVCCSIFDHYAQPGEYVFVVAPDPATGGPGCAGALLRSSECEFPVFRVTCVDDCGMCWGLGGVACGSDWALVSLVPEGCEVVYAPGEAEACHYAVEVIQFGNMIFMTCTCPND